MKRESGDNGNGGALRILSGGEGMRGVLVWIALLAAAALALAACLSGCAP